MRRKSKKDRKSFGTQWPFSTEGNDWILSYSDLMTLLLGFFVILYSFSEINDETMKSITEGISESFKSKSEPKKTSKEQLKRQEVPTRTFSMVMALLGLSEDPNEAISQLQSAATQQRLREDWQLDSNESLEASPNTSNSVDQGNTKKIKIHLDSDLLFASGQFQLTEPSKLRIAELYSQIEPNQNSLQLLVSGHTDPIPAKGRKLMPNNSVLSVLRANSVADYLRQLGFPSSRLAIAGYGAQKPIATFTETTQAAERKAIHQLNRRVEIEVLYDAH